MENDFGLLLLKSAMSSASNLHHSIPTDAPQGSFEKETSLQRAAMHTVHL